MQNQSAPEIRPHVEIINGSIRTTSPKVAEHFGRLHKDVLKAIKELDCSADFHQRNFAPMSIDVKIGNGAIRKSPAYEITRDGFTFLAMGFTGKEAARWKEAYINAFNQMEATLAKPQYALKDLRSKKALPGGLTLEQQDAIKEMVRTRAEEAPEARRGIVAVKLWSALKAKFGCPYKLIPPEHFTDALSLLARLEIEGETPPALAAPVVSPIAHHPGSAARGRERIDTLRLWANRGLPEHVRDPFLTALADIERSLTMGWTEVDEATMHIWTGLALLKRWKSLP